MKWNLKGLLVGSTLLLAACSQDVVFDLGAKQDQFQQNYSYNNKVDILWIVDTSTSMDQHQQKLSAQIPALVEALNKLKMDYHVAVVTTSMGGATPDGGQFIGTPKYLTQNSPNLVNSLKAKLILGSNGSSRERGLESMKEALSPTNLEGDGKGFFRDEALLVVIALSNEDDKSPPADPVNHYSQFLDSIKKPWDDGTRSWVFNFIGVLPTSTNCSTMNEYTEIGEIFVDLVQFSGGYQGSICGNSLAYSVAGIKAKVTQILTDFKLSKLPVVDTIVVKVNNQIVPQNSENGWGYVADKNLVRFYGSAVPAADASINVDFKPREAN